MIKISKKSWHFKINQLLYDKQQEYIDKSNNIYLDHNEIKNPETFKSLCNYFWFSLENIVLFICYCFTNILLYKIPKTRNYLIDDRSIEIYKKIGYGEYITMVLFFSLTLSFIFSFVAILLSNSLALIYMSLVYGWESGKAVFNNPDVKCSVIITALIFFSVLIFLIFLRKKSPTREIVKAYKEKYCPMIAFKD